GPLGRLAKWVRRRPAVAALLAILITLTVGAIAVITHFWLTAEDALLAKDRALEETEQARLTTEGALKDRERSLKDAEEARHKAETSLYQNQLASARLALAGDDLALAKKHLDECDPKLRDRDWQRLYRSCTALVHSFRVTAQGPAQAIVFSGDGRYLVALGRGHIVKLWDVARAKEIAEPVTSNRLAPIAVFNAQNELACVENLQGSALRLLFFAGASGKQTRTRVIGRQVNVPTRLCLSGDGGRLELLEDNKEGVEGQ